MDDVKQSVVVSGKVARWWVVLRWEGIGGCFVADK